jgi:hypothetical protein
VSESVCCMALDMAIRTLLLVQANANEVANGPIVVGVQKRALKCECRG